MTGTVLIHVINNVELSPASGFRVAIAADAESKIIGNTVNVLDVYVSAVCFNPFIVIMNARPIRDKGEHVLSGTAMIDSSNFLSRRMYDTRIFAIKW